jgi:hypothetical protein
VTIVAIRCDQTPFWGSGVKEAGVEFGLLRRLPGVR